MTRAEAVLAGWVLLTLAVVAIFVIVLARRER